MYDNLIFQKACDQGFWKDLENRELSVIENQECEIAKHPDVEINKACGDNVCDILENQDFGIDQFDQ